MPRRWRSQVMLAVLLAAGASLPASGCRTLDTVDALPAAPLPSEFARTTQPRYVIDVPDILLIDALRVVPRPPYRVQPLDSLLIQASNVLPAEPIAGLYGIEADGTVNLGPSYGSVLLAGLTI